MTIVRPFPKIVDVDLNQPGLRCFCDDAMPERSIEEIGEDGQDVKNHVRGVGPISSLRGSPLVRDGASAKHSPLPPAKM